jgi:ribosomal protein L29
MKQIEEFEKTVSELAANVENLKKKLLTNKEKYGTDISKWPQM